MNATTHGPRITAPLSPTARVVLSVLVDRQALRARLAEHHIASAITIRDLAAALGPSVTRRDVEEALAELALAGHPIVSATSGDDRGVRLTTDPAEVRACARAYGRRTATQYLRVRALRQTAAQMAQPETLWERVS